MGSGGAPAEVVEATERLVQKLTEDGRLLVAVLQRFLLDREPGFLEGA